MATMGDIAKKAGVSLSTVSYVLSGERPISEATRQKVLATMAELDYRPNALARGLASRRSRMVALVAGDPGHGFGSTEMALVQAASAAAKARGYHLVLWPDDEPGSLVDLAGQGLVEGVLLMEVRIGDPRLELLGPTGLALACLGRAHGPSDPDGNQDIPWVDIDYHATMATAMETLTSMGHRRIALVNQSSDARDQGYGPVVRISDAYRKAVRQRGLEEREVWTESSATGGLAAFERLKHSDGSLPDAILVMNDPAVPGVLKACAHQGLRVPGDLSVLSLLSSARMAELSVPALACMEIPAAQLGKAGVDFLLDHLEARAGTAAASPSPGESRLWACNLVMRESVAPPAV